MKKIFITVAVSTILFAPTILLVHAETGSVPPVALVNPIKYTSISAIVGAILNGVEYIGGICCALWIIWGGFLFVKAQGNPDALSDAKKTLLHAVIGTAIILGAGAILTIIQSTITAIKS